MSEVKVSQLPQANTLSTNDRVVVLISPGNSNASLRTTTTSNLRNFLVTNTVPANSTSNGTIGQLAFNNTHLFVCISNNNWGRISLQTGW